MQALGCALQAAVRSGDADGDVLVAEANGEVGEALRRDAEAALRCRFEAVVEVVDALVAAVDGVAEAGEDGLRRETGVTLAGVEEVKAAGAVDSLCEGLDALFDAVLGGGD
jgi:hypothetical protein